MRLNKEERYRLRLMRLAEEISRKGYHAQYIYRPYYTLLIHNLIVFNKDNKIVIDVEHSEPDCCYDLVIKACMEKGVIQ